MPRLAIAFAIVLATWSLTGATAAQASQCLAYVQGPPAVVPAAFRPASLSPAVGIRFVGHATFRIETPGGVVIATDYTGNHGPGRVPDVVTMNHAHSTHYTDYPDPAIHHVLRGWNPAGGPAEHDLTVGDVRIRNVPTDIRGWERFVEPDGNSIFIFEVADLCIGHLGHLHHRLSAEDLALIGRLDVVMAPVDGSFTLDLPSMIATLKDLRASLVIPMHFFGGASLNRFVAGMRDKFEIRVAEAPVIEVSLDSLPHRPTVLVPRGR